MSGPQSELEKIKPHMDGRLTIKYADLDSGSLLLSPLPTSCQDTHVTIIPEFIVPAERLAEFKAGFSKFYTATKTGAGAAGILFYGFAISGNSVYCREAYKVGTALCTAVCTAVSRCILQCVPVYCRETYKVALQPYLLHYYSERRCCPPTRS